MEIRVLCTLFLFLLSCGQVVGEEQIKWTPNDDAENAPLPLSMRQRQQLLQLENTIRSSPDPSGTLQQVAEQNGMSPQDLVNMLEKNSRDLQQDPSLLQPATVSSVVSKVFASIGLLISQSAKRHPQSFAMTTSLLLFLLYASMTIPRTGMHVSSGTALFAPPQRYLQKLSDSPALQGRGLSIKSQKTVWDDLQMERDGVETHKLPRKSDLAQAISSQVTLGMDEFIDSDEEDEDVELEILDLLFENSANVISERLFTEFPSEAKPMKSATSKKHGVLMVPGLGSFGRFGLVRFQITRQMETDKDASLTLTTTKRDFFDGQIHIQARKFRSKVIISAHLAVPKRSRKLGKKAAWKIVEDLTASISQSASQRTRQNLARRSIGKRFKSAGRTRASDRRKARFEREKEIEEMAEDRRRKWQRSNPDAGRYRPSGDRQRSPNNC